MTTRYGAMDNAGQQEAERLTLISAEHDRGSIRNLEALGVATGWTCLEVGPGDGSIAAWLCERVGPSGRVVVTDIDTSRVSRLRYPNLDIRTLNILTDALPQQAFDLVFARFVVEHLPEPDTALATMAGAVRPGGWLLVEDQDQVGFTPDPNIGADAVALFNSWCGPVEHRRQGLFAAGTNAFYGRELVGGLRRAGLVDIGAEGRVNMCYGGAPFNQRWGVLFEGMRQQWVESGKLSNEDLDAWLAFLRNPDMLFMGQVIMAAWGRQPAAG